jgi:hypothetical protein
MATIDEIMRKYREILNLRILRKRSYAIEENNTSSIWYTEYVI